MVIFHSTVTLEKEHTSDENKSAQLSIIMAHFCFPLPNSNLCAGAILTDV